MLRDCGGACEAVATGCLNEHNTKSRPGVEVGGEALAKSAIKVSLDK